MFDDPSLFVLVSSITGVRKCHTGRLISSIESMVPFLSRLTSVDPKRDATEERRRPSRPALLDEEGCICGCRTAESLRPARGARGPYQKLVHTHQAEVRGSVAPPLTLAARRRTRSAPEGAGSGPGLTCHPDRGATTVEQGILMKTRSMKRRLLSVTTISVAAIAGIAAPVGPAAADTIATTTTRHWSATRVPLAEGEGGLLGPASPSAAWSAMTILRGMARRFRSARVDLLLHQSRAVPQGRPVCAGGSCLGKSPHGGRPPCGKPRHRAPQTTSARESWRCPPGGALQAQRTLR